ncbi:MAG: hypothetical protein JW974_02260 [Alphaproteobacteria bacterium]|nr:hypothetical protein [Alphaproteobacteria bacterium]MBN2675044.1 hypothetical protein [Alphaproteobacteria bacterium]
MIIKVPNHKRLNPKIWLKDGSLRPDVAVVLDNMVVSIISSLSTFSKIPIDFEKDIEEVVLCGSCANYFYRKKSDLDMKIIVRQARYLEKMDMGMYKVFSKFISSYFVKKYSPNIFGIPVDIGIVGTAAEITKYSLMQKKWIIEPERLTDEECKYINYRSKLYYLAIKKMVKNIIKDKNKHADTPKFYAYLRTKRVKSWDDKFNNREPFSIALSNLSDTGIIDKMLNLNKELIQDLMTDINQDN